jgi:hypothetical protein
MAAGARAAPDIVYARGVPADFNPDINAFNRKDCSLILIEVGFCKDLGCYEKYDAKTDKYLFLLNAQDDTRDVSNLYASPSATPAPPSLTPRTTSHPPWSRSAPPSLPIASKIDTKCPTRALPPPSTTKG